MLGVDRLPVIGGVRVLSSRAGTVCSVSPVVDAALIAGAISVASFAFNAWTTSVTLHAGRKASLTDRQVDVYRQVLAFCAHQTEVRLNRTRTHRYTPVVEERLQALLDTYSPPNWFELEADVLALCPEAVVDAFLAAKKADDAVWYAEAAHAEAEFRARIRVAAEKDSALIEVVRTTMLGGRLTLTNRSLIGKLLFEVQKRRSLR